MALNATYQGILEAGLARQRANEARQRALATRGAAAAGVQTSGVSQIPQAEIGRAALIGEAELGATVAQQSEAERLQDKAVEQQKELAAYQDTLSTAAETRRRKWAKSSAAAGLGSQIIGAGIGGVTGYLTKKYLT